jgi:hypothetical protein
LRRELSAEVAPFQKKPGDQIKAVRQGQNSNEEAGNLEQ